MTLAWKISSPFWNRPMVAISQGVSNQRAGYLARRKRLNRKFHTPMETPTVRRVGARGLQEQRALVGRMPPRGVHRYEKFRLEPGGLDDADQPAHQQIRRAAQYHHGQRQQGDDRLT